MVQILSLDRINNRMIERLNAIARPRIRQLWPLMMSSSRQLSSYLKKEGSRALAREREYPSKARGKVDRPRNRLCRVTLYNEPQPGASSRRAKPPFSSRIRITASRKTRRSKKKIVTLRERSRVSFAGKKRQRGWSAYG